MCLSRGTDLPSILRAQKLLRSVCASAQSDYSLPQVTHWVANNPKRFEADNKNSNQTVRIRRLIRDSLGAHAVLAEMMCPGSTVRQQRKIVIDLNLEQPFQRKKSLDIPMDEMSRNVRKRTLWHVQTTKTQIRLRVSAVWFVSSLSA